jgi:succinoglycan biosynthesis protein ExoA
MKKVSIIVPCLNEEKTIQLLLQAIHDQTYPRQDLEVIIADGMSGDATRQRIKEYAHNHQDLRIRIVDNPKSNIPAGLNKAIASARSPYIVRLDAHSIPAADYVSRCVRALEKGRGTNVGGRWEIEPGGPGWKAKSIAAAASNPIGVGDASYRYGGRAGIVDTVPFGSYLRQDILDLGGYNESLLTNEDYEVNVRIREHGGKVWFDPDIKSTYFARTNFKDLAKQYFRYGFWKLQMLRSFPQTIRWRQFMPPAFLCGLFLLGLLSLALSKMWIVLVAVIALYVVILVIAGLKEAVRKKDISMVPGVAIAISTMHFAWGSGFLASLFRRHG